MDAFCRCHEPPDDEQCVCVCSMSGQVRHEQWIAALRVCMGAQGCAREGGSGVRGRVQSAEKEMNSAVR